LRIQLLTPSGPGEEFPFRHLNEKINSFIEIALISRSNHGG